MKLTRERSLITALIRLISVFYSIRALDASVTVIYTLWLQESMQSELMVLGWRAPWTLFISAVLIYAGIAISVYFLAPTITAGLVSEDHPTDESGILWNETMIFCCGLAFIAWGITRIVDWVLTRLADPTSSYSALGETPEIVRLILALVIIGAGIILVAKFHRISAWMAQRKQCSYQALTDRKE